MAQPFAARCHSPQQKKTEQRDDVIKRCRQTMTREKATMRIELRVENTTKNCYSMYVRLDEFCERHKSDSAGDHSPLKSHDSRLIFYSLSPFPLNLLTLSTSLERATFFFLFSFRIFCVSVCADRKCALKTGWWKPKYCYSICATVSVCA